VNAVMNLRVPQNVGKLPNCYTIGGLLSSAQFHHSGNDGIIMQKCYTPSIKTVALHTNIFASSCDIAPYTSKCSLCFPYILIRNSLTPNMNLPDFFV
jgi:hypothetical protein